MKKLLNLNYFNFLLTKNTEVSKINKILSLKSTYFLKDAYTIMISEMNTFNSLFLNLVK